MGKIKSEYALGVLTTHEIAAGRVGSKFELLNGIQEHVFLAATRACGHVVAFERAGDKLEILIANCKACDAHLHEILLPTQGQAPASLARSDSMEQNRLFINALTAFRLYIDHTTTRLTRLYGKTAAPLLAFSECTSHEFDSVFEYRFVTKLRNYVQHCGMPLNVFSEKQAMTSKGLGDRTYEIGFNPKKLLQDYDGWGPVKKDLLACKTDFIEAVGMLEKIVDCLRRVHSKTEAAELPFVKKIANDILVAVQPATKLRREPVLIRLHRGTDTAELTALPEFVLKKLRLR